MNPRDAFLGVERSASYAERVLAPLRPKATRQQAASPSPAEPVEPAESNMPKMNIANADNTPPAVLTAARIPVPAECSWADAVRGITVLERRTVISFDVWTAAAWAVFAERGGA